MIELFQNFQSCYFSRRFIAASEPESEKETNFWQMVVLQAPALIVALDVMVSTHPIPNQ